MHTYKRNEHILQGQPSAAASSVCCRAKPSDKTVCGEQTRSQDSESRTREEQRGRQKGNMGREGKKVKLSRLLPYNTGVFSWSIYINKCCHRNPPPIQSSPTQPTNASPRKGLTSDREGRVPTAPLFDGVLLHHAPAVRRDNWDTFSYLTNIF